MFDVPPSPSSILHPPSSILLATWLPAQLSVYFLAPSSPDTLLHTLLNLVAAPCILFTPTPVRHPEFHKLCAQKTILHLPLSDYLSLSAPGAFKPIAPIAPILAAFSQRIKAGNSLETSLQQIHLSLEAVARQNAGLLQENENLRRLSSQAYFQFAMTIDPVDFRYFAAIFTLGDRAKAARALGIKASTFYLRVHSWRARGPEYHRMLRLLEARKKLATKKEVRLSESLQSGGVQADAENPEILQDVLERIKAVGNDARGYPALLKDILDALLQMKDGNWDDIRAELVPMLQEETSA